MDTLLVKPGESVKCTENLMSLEILKDVLNLREGKTVLDGVGV